MATSHINSIIQGFQQVLGQGKAIEHCGPRIAAAGASPGPLGPDVAIPRPHGVRRGRSGKASGHGSGKPALPRVQPPFAPSGRGVSLGLAKSFSGLGH